MEGLIAPIALNLYQSFLVCNLQEVKIEVYKILSIMENVVCSPGERSMVPGSEQIKGKISHKTQ